MATGRSNSIGPCQVLNSSLITRPASSLVHVLPSPDQKKILVQIGTLTTSQNVTTETSSQLIYVPLNGKASLMVNSPVVSTEAISQATFLGDSQTILFLGDQVTPGEENVFLWKAPDSF